MRCAVNGEDIMSTENERIAPLHAYHPPARARAHRLVHRAEWPKLINSFVVVVVVIVVPVELLGRTCGVLTSRNLIPAQERILLPRPSAIWEGQRWPNFENASEQASLPPSLPRIPAVAEERYLVSLRPSSELIISLAKQS